LCAATGATAPPVLPPACAPRARTPLEARQAPRAAEQGRRGSARPELPARPCGEGCALQRASGSLNSNPSTSPCQHSGGGRAQQRTSGGAPSVSGCRRCTRIFLRASPAAPPAAPPSGAERSPSGCSSACSVLGWPLRAPGAAGVRPGWQRPCGLAISLVRAGRPISAAPQQKMAGPGSLPITAVHPDTMPRAQRRSTALYMGCRGRALAAAAATGVAAMARAVPGAADAAHAAQLAKQAATRAPVLRVLSAAASQPPLAPEAPEC